MTPNPEPAAPEQRPERPPRKQEISPFWSYQDLLLFALLAVPCLLVSALIGRATAAAFGPARIWFAFLLFYLLWFTSLCIMLRIGYNRPFWSSLGWTYPERGKIAAIFGGPVLAFIVGGLGQALHTPIIDSPFKKFLQDPLSLALFALFSTIVGPVCEELAFRGFFMPLLIRSFGAVAGIVLSAVPFALLHGDQYAWTWQYLALILLAGAVFGWVRYLTRSTLASAMMHSTYNLTFFVAFIAGGRT